MEEAANRVRERPHVERLLEVAVEACGEEPSRLPAAATSSRRRECPGRSSVAFQPAHASVPSMSGSRRSIRITSGRSLAAARSPRRRSPPRASGTRRRAARRARASGSSRCRRRSGRAGPAVRMPDGTAVSSSPCRSGSCSPRTTTSSARASGACSRRSPTSRSRPCAATSTRCSPRSSAEQPDVVVTDIRMPPGDTDEGIQAADAAARDEPRGRRRRAQPVREPELRARAARGRQRGRAYLLKERVNDLDQLVAAIRAVAEGGSVIDPKVVEALVAENARGEESPLNELTPRERDVLREMAEGKNNAAIAAALVLTERSVEKVIHSIFLKLGLTWEPAVHKRVKAVILYLAGERLVSREREAIRGDIRCRARTSGWIISLPPRAATRSPIRRRPPFDGSAVTKPQPSSATSKTSVSASDAGSRPSPSLPCRRAGQRFGAPPGSRSRRWPLSSGRRPFGNASTSTRGHDARVRPCGSQCDHETTRASRSGG